MCLTSLLLQDVPLSLALSPPLSSLRLNLQNASTLIWIRKSLRSFSINHLSAEPCYSPFLQTKVKSAGAHVKQLIWLGPSYITTFVMPRQTVRGASRGLCSVLETTPLPSIEHTQETHALTQSLGSICST